MSVSRDSGARILVCSRSNHGTDNILLKARPFFADPEDRIARVGLYERVAETARAYYLADRDIGPQAIVFATIDALAPREIAGARVYDYVLLDEANRAGILDSLLALARGKRMILVGGSMHLQPVLSQAGREVAGRARRRQKGARAREGGRTDGRGDGGDVGQSLFAWLMERGYPEEATVPLDQQNRMHPDIGAVVSEVFYRGRISTVPAAPRERLNLALLGDPVT